MIKNDFLFIYGIIFWVFIHKKKGKLMNTTKKHIKIAKKHRGPPCVFGNNMDILHKICIAKMTKMTKLSMNMV